MDDEHPTRTHRVRHGRIGGTCAPGDLDNVTFAGYDPTVAIHDLQRIKPGDEPGRPYEMGPGTTGLRPNLVSPCGIRSTPEHANEPSSKPRLARPPTRCRIDTIMRRAFLIFAGPCLPTCVPPRHACG